MPSRVVSGFASGPSSCCSSWSATGAVVMVATLHLIRRPQRRQFLPLRPLLIAHGRHLWLLHTLRTYNPAQRALLLAHRIAQEQNPLEERVRARRATRDVDVDRQEFVHALYHAVDVVHSARV